jgi:hypothetical protein
MKKKESENVEICRKCKVKMKVVGHNQRMLDRDEIGELSDGEESDYIAAELGGDDSGRFTVSEIVYECPKCHGSIIVESY